MANSLPSEDPASQIEKAAADWLARRDRGLSAAEQDAFLQWMRENPRHRNELARLERTWGALDLLSEWRPAHSGRPNPNLLASAPRSSRRRLWYWGGSLAAAAAIALGFFTLQSPPEKSLAPAVALRVIPGPERVELEDGSVVEANQGGAFELAFTASERRIRLVSGEAHFTVAKNPQRPFVVEVAGTIAVRALGTAFNVRRAAGAVDVLVTAGKVQVESPAGTAAGPAATPTALVAGQQATVDASQPNLPPVVTTLTSAQIDQVLAWQGVRLIFDDLPLSAVVAEFNLRNRQQLVIADPRIASLRVAGSFRADNVEAFSRLLEASFGVAVQRRVDGTLVLRRGD
jgi:transmembrane sensor